MLLHQMQPEYMAQAFLMMSGTRSNQGSETPYDGAFSHKTQQQGEGQQNQPVEQAFNLYDDKHLLPESYKPCPNTVIVGRGREPKENEGNKRLRVLAAQYLAQFK